MNTKLKKVKNIFCRILCCALAIFVIVTLFLPVAAITNIGELLDDIIMETNMFSSYSANERVINNAIDGIVEDNVLFNIIIKISKINPSDFGKASNSYGYDDGKLAAKISKYYEKMSDKYASQLEGIYDEKTMINKLISVLKKDSFQEDLAGYLYGSALYSLYINGLAEELNVEKLAEGVSEVFSVIGEGEFSVFDLSKLINGFSMVVTEVNNSEALTEALSDIINVRLKSYIEIAALARTILIAFIAAYFVFELLTIIGCVINKKRMSLTFCILSAFCSAVILGALYYAKSMADSNVRSTLASFDIGTSVSILSITKWPALAVLASALILVFICVLWGKSKMLDKVSVSDGWICANCGNSSDPDSSFCIHCGTKRPMPDVQICPNCGANNANDARFCIQCGSSLTTKG